MADIQKQKILKISIIWKQYMIYCRIWSTKHLKLTGKKVNLQIKD